MSQFVSLRPVQPASSRTWARGLTASLTTQHLGGPCRVCSEPVPRGAPAWHVAWRLGIAHELCGYLRPEEYEPHEVRTEGRVMWSWRCPTCKRDAGGLERPEDGDPMECHRCRPRGLVVGALVASTTRFTLRMRGGRVTVERGARGIVVGVPDVCGALVVRWRAPEVECAVTVHHVRTL